MSKILAKNTLLLCFSDPTLQYRITVQVAGSPLGYTVTWHSQG